MFYGLCSLVSGACASISAAAFARQARPDAQAKGEATWVASVQKRMANEPYHPATADHVCLVRFFRTE